MEALLEHIERTRGLADPAPQSSPIPRSLHAAWTTELRTSEGDGVSDWLVRHDESCMSNSLYNVYKSRAQPR